MEASISEIGPKQTQKYSPKAKAEEVKSKGSKVPEQGTNETTKAMPPDSVKLSSKLSSEVTMKTEPRKRSFLRALFEGVVNVGKSANTAKEIGRAAAMVDNNVAEINGRDDVDLKIIQEANALGEESIVLTADSKILLLRQDVILKKLDKLPEGEERNKELEKLAKITKRMNQIAARMNEIKAKTEILKKKANSDPTVDAITEKVAANEAEVQERALNMANANTKVIVKEKVTAENAQIVGEITVSTAGIYKTVHAGAEDSELKEKCEKGINEIAAYVPAFLAAVEKSGASLDSETMAELSLIAVSLTVSGGSEESDAVDAVQEELSGMLLNLLLLGSLKSGDAARMLEIFEEAEKTEARYQKLVEKMKEEKKTEEIKKLEKQIKMELDTLKNLIQAVIQALKTGNVDPKKLGMALLRIQFQMARVSRLIVKLEEAMVKLEEMESSDQ